MLRLSVNVLFSVVYILKLIREHSFNDLVKLRHVVLPTLISIDDIIALCKTCKWVSIKNNIISISPTIDYLSHNSFDNDLQPATVRKMLLDFIENCRPAWRALIPRGRQETYIFMSDDEKACFKLAGLMDIDPNDEIVRWWDDVAARQRVVENDIRTEIGRIGERLTIKYEQRRTGCIPKWVALESNLLGYDILSQIDEEHAEKLLIEVKTSRRPISEADFYISRNEWQIAEQSKHYKFYLFSLHENKVNIAIIPKDIIKKHIPDDNQGGEWQKVKIGFIEFSNSFKLIDKNILA